MTSRPPITPQLLETRVMAILRAPHAKTLAPAVSLLVDAGVRCLEVALTSDGALDLIRSLRAELPSGVAVGAGTVITAADAHDALEAGAEFIVSPSTSPEVLEIGCAAGKAVYPGAWTATEIVRAWELGAAAVKLFPVVTGGPANVRQLRAPLPHIPMLAVGGVSMADATDYLAAGAIGVGIGSALTEGFDPDGDTAALTASVRRLLAACARLDPGVA